jgi:hypothetical protein
VTKFTFVSYPQGEVWVSGLGWFIDQIRGLLETSQGGTRIYHESQHEAVKEALVKFQQKRDTKAVSSVIPSYISGQVCFVMTTSPFIQINLVHSSSSVSFTSMMHLLHRVYSTNSWRSPLPGGICQQLHSLPLLTILKTHSSVIG